MNATIRNIGNLKGVILPKSILTKCDIETDVSIEVKGRRIIITASPVPKRKGWQKAFKEMAKNAEDALVIPEIFNDESTDDGKWK